MTRKSRILGGLLGGAVGDAMGAATETRTTALIQACFGGYVKDILDPPGDNDARGTKAGMVTDDFSTAYYAAQDIAAAGGKVAAETINQSLLRWAENPAYTRYATLATRDAVTVLRGGRPAPTKYDNLLCDNRKTTSDAGMKAAPVGWFNACNINKAIDETIVFSSITHNNYIAISGACAVAAATAKAMADKATVFEVIQAGICGAAEGYRRASLTARPVSGASVEKRMQLAVELGLRCRHDFEKAMAEIAAIIGTGTQIYEAVPAAFGFLAASEGNVMETIWMAVNAGGDTCAVASVAGAIAGTLCGGGQIPQKYLPLIDSMNGFDLNKLAVDIDALLG
ncbi:MAG: ADP-ribosylglycohydrolase family protein [Christensenellales bacterium]